MRRILLPFLILMVGSLYANYRTDLYSTAAPKVYIDGDFGERDYIRSEITFVNYVIDRKEADIHVLITRQRTGSGGREYTFTFFGQDRFSSTSDTLRCFTLNDDTDDLIRKKVVKTIKIGLLSFLADSPIIDEISIRYAKSGDVRVKKDRWDNWLFRFGVNGSIRGEKHFKNNRYNLDISAKRITDVWKIDIEADYRYNKEDYTVDDELISSTTGDKSFDGLIVRSLSDHWSVGLAGGTLSSVYRNYQWNSWVRPAIEFNIFPYSESTRRELRILYAVGISKRDYNDMTIYDKLSENLISQTLQCALELKQPWGSVRTSISGAHYIHDLNLNHFSIYSRFNVKLFKGFSVRLSGSVSMIHDRLSLPKGDADIEEVLLHRRQLETDYSYNASLGFEYAFGSMFNNIVNPRFGG